MNASTTRPRPFVLIALDAANPKLVNALAERYPRVHVRLDPCDAITPAALRENRVLAGLLRKAKQGGGRLHLIGVISDAGVHASLDHLSSVLEVAAEQRVRVVVHAVLDGVDVPAKTALGFLARLEGLLDGGVGRIGTVSGRALAMDSEGHWDRTEKVVRAIMADGPSRQDSACRGVEEACAFGNPESFVAPFIVSDYPGVSLVDAALHLNFAKEGARQLAHALAGAKFDGFARKGGRGAFDGRFACMTPYDSALSLPTLFARAPDPSSLPLDYLTSAGMRHVQYAEGSASAIGKQAEEGIRSGAYDFVLVDFGNPDSASALGSAGQLEQALAQVVEAARAAGGAALVVGGRDAHNETALIYINDADRGAKLREHGHCEDLAPTLLELLQLPQPADVEGISLLVR